MWRFLIQAPYYEALVIKTKLESEGISVKLERETIGSLYGINYGIGFARIFVPDIWRKLAAEIISL